jgi:WhiB family redox-sensing transcriptional regulator
MFATKNCAECGIVFHHTASNHSGWGQKKFCTPACRKRSGRRARGVRVGTRDYIADRKKLLPLYNARDGWQRDAACRGVDLKEFYDYEEKLAGAEARREANAVINTWCRHCPVRRDCLANAIATSERWGIWGGTTAPERKSMRRANRRLPQPVEGVMNVPETMNVTALVTPLRHGVSHTVTRPDYLVTNM